MASKLIEKRAELDAKRTALHGIFEEAGADLDLSLVKSLEGDTHQKAAEIKRRNTELGELGKEVEELALVERAAADVKAAQEQATRNGQSFSHLNPVPPSTPVTEQKDLGSLFLESATFKQRVGNRGPVSFIPDISFKTLMTQAAGWAPQSLRQPGWVPSAQMQPTLIDLIPAGQTTQAAVVYMLESTFTNNAAGRTEGANNAGEAALALTATTVNVMEYAVWIPVTAEQLEDVPYVQSYINNRLTLMLRQAIEADLMTGGGAPAFAGMIGHAGAQTQAKGADPVMDAIHKGITLCNVTARANADGIAMHPNDWQDIRLTRTADGIYILGNPGDNGPKQLWGLPVVTSTAVTENTAVICDWRNFTQLVERRGIQFEMTDSHASLFIQRTLAILASVRLAFPIYRNAAIVQVTGI